MTNAHASPDAIARVLTEGVDELVWQQSEPLAVIGPDWRRWIARESVNQAILVAALLQVARELPGVRKVAVYGLTSMTEALCTGLRQGSRSDVHLVSGSYPTAARQLFGCPVRSRSEPLRDYDLIVSSDDSPEPTAHGEAGERWLDLGHPAVLDCYQELLQHHRRTLQSQLEALNVGHGNTVLFVARKAFFNQLRTSTALRRRGWMTAAVVFDRTLASHKQGHFDALVETDLCSLMCWLNQASGVRLHTQGWMFRYHIPTLIEAAKPADCQQVVETMDLNSFVFPAPELPRLLPAMRAAWGGSVERDHSVQCRCEDYLVRYADAMLFSGTAGYEQALGLESLGRSSHYLHFPCYPLRDFFAKRTANRRAGSCTDARQLRLVFAGGVVPQQARRPSALFSDAQLVSTFSSFARAGLQLDVYNSPLLADADSYELVYPEHLDLARRHPNYRFLRGRPPWELNSVLAQYDYGLMVYDFDTCLVGEQHHRTIVPSKLFMYLEAGLPVLISSRFVFACRLIEEHGCGAVVSPSDLGRFSDFLLELDHEALRRAAYAAREALEMDGQIERLIRVYERDSPTAGAERSGH